MPLSYIFLKGELEYARHSGISTMKFLQCAFNLSDDELQELKKSIEDVSVHTSDEYPTFREEFERRAMLFQSEAKLPFSRMADMILPYPHNLEGIWHRLRLVDINREAPSSWSSPRFWTAKPSSCYFLSIWGDTLFVLCIGRSCLDLRYKNVARDIRPHSGSAQQHHRSINSLARYPCSCLSTTTTTSTKLVYFLIIPTGSRNGYA